MNRLPLFLIAFGLFGFSLHSCDSSSSTEGVEEWGPITITAGTPLILLPSSRLQVEGGPFPDPSFGPITLNISGVFSSEGATYNVEEHRLATWDSHDRISVEIPPDLYQRLAGGDMRSGTLSARVWVEAVSLGTQKSYRSQEVPVSLTLATTLVPTLEAVSSGAVVHFASPVVFTGHDLLLGGEEGETVMVLDGCFAPLSSQGDCATSGLLISSAEVPVSDLTPLDRTGGSFGLPVSLFGVEPGTFEGSVKLRNRSRGHETESLPLPFTVDLLEAEITAVHTAESSLGGYITFAGEGFAPQGVECGTDLLYEGEFQSSAGGVTPLSLILVPEVVSSRSMHVVLEEGVDLGATLDLRKADGLLVGRVTPRVCCGPSCQEGHGVDMRVGIGPVKQVVQLQFQDSYIASLAAFGLQGAHQKIKDRIVEVIERIYQGINLEVRTAPVEDYALYSIVEIHGFDPNSLGLMGYDNSVGKDVGNLRLYDVIGGVNAHTQEDGYPGYGGVFLESYLGFSQHPPEGVTSIDLASPLFDMLFDPFRPDRGGDPVTAEDLRDFALVVDGLQCLEPQGRKGRVACAVFVMANLVGGTIAHELGHSMGLAEPSSSEVFHNLGDEPLRLMDSGGSRPFLERAGLDGAGEEMFCISNYQYLQSIMPDPGHVESGEERPGC